nr:bifunctional hydroxymethylpyrimidine kinase/phosphomethylpyrimidine kinase [Propionicimonas sp.]
MSPRIALTIAGSDPSGGAGIQADLKTFSALGVYGTAVITALTAQNTRAVTGVRPVDVDFVVEQLETLVADVRIDAIKIGMLGTAELVRAVTDFLDRHPCPTVVLDPVMVATSGDSLLAADSLDALRNALPRASLVTPNLAEAAMLLGQPVAEDIPTMHQQARALATLGAPRVLVKGGHLTDAAVDVLYEDGRTVELTAQRIATPNTHGTGCSLSSAIAAIHTRQPDWHETVSTAKHWLTAAIRAADHLDVGTGHGPVHHFHQWWQ